MSYFAITSNHPRHVKFLETLYEQVDVPLVIVVSKGPIAQEEADYFNSNLSLLHRPNILRCTRHQLHSNFVLQTLAKMDPQVGFVFGAPLLKEEIFGMPKYGCVNIHTGLVKHYRGVDSSLWAMHDNNPGLIGATLHYIDKSIDAGEVIAMKNINIDKFDNLDTLFFKSCQVGFRLLTDNINDIIANKTNKKKIETKGVLYQNKDKNPEIVKRAEINLRRFKNENYS
tara:strand:- start:367 stop:1047 length:681 start_codon:yes stop_codon:yes gene_type:complete